MNPSARNATDAETVADEDAKAQRRYRLIAACVFVMGIGQMVGDLVGSAAIKAVFAATMLSPCPKVFTAHKGLETYSTRFFIEYDDSQGAPQSIQITPERYRRLLGPYNRRNVYGAVLAFGPVLSRDPVAAPMFWQVARFALTGKAPLLRELGIEPEGIAGNVRVRYEPVAGASMGDWPRVLEVSPP